MRRILCSIVVAMALVPGLALGEPPESDSKGGSGTDAELRPQPQPASLKLNPDGTALGEKPELDVSRMIFDPESIRQVVRYHMPEIQECYEKALSDSGARLEGRVMVSFVIDTDGRVNDAKVVTRKTTLKDERVQDCALLVRRWAFPKPGDNRDHPIEYPFDLKVVHK